MVKRSLQASCSGIEQAKRAFDYKGWTQENLAGEVGLKTRQSIWRFFTGKPIDRNVFLDICLVLDLDWRQIASNPPMELPTEGLGNPSDIFAMVRQVRSQRQDKVQAQCGTLHLINISRPISIDDLYINVNILAEALSQQWLELDDLQDAAYQQPHHWERNSSIGVTGMEAIEICSKLRVLGKAGIGKTTFLQHLAIECNRGNFAESRVPVFVTLRDFAADSRQTGEFNLLKYIHAEFLTTGAFELSMVEMLLREGRLLLLLDGLDEVMERSRQAVAQEIRRFSEKYQQNQIVVTCRTAVAELMRFSDVEIAPFTINQIEDFAQRWFAVVPKTDPQRSQEQAIQFIEKLQLPENNSFWRLASTPLFLHLICWVFHCRGDFPQRRSQFYKQCLDLLLSRWDEIRGVERDEIYAGLLLPQKLKLLSQIAFAGLEQGYFFEVQAIENQVHYLLADSWGEPEERRWITEKILKAIELQHGVLSERAPGIFSFSYPILQEYLIARKIAGSSELSPQSLEVLVDKIEEPKWREIFLLTATMLSNADSLLQMMRGRRDAIGVDDQDLCCYITQMLSSCLNNGKASPGVRLEIEAALESLVFIQNG